jgi:hypothetical protein
MRDTAGSYQRQYQATGLCDGPLFSGKSVRLTLIGKPLGYVQIVFFPIKTQADLFEVGV